MWRMLTRGRRPDGRWTALARALADAGFWSGLPPADAQARQSEVAAGGYPFSGDVLDDVTFLADGEELAEGHVEDLLREMAPALQRHGVRLQVDTIAGDDEYIVDINGRRCLVLNADDWSSNSPWFEATVRPVAVVNELLAEASARVRVHLLHAGGNDGMALLLDPAVVEAVRTSGLFAGGDIPELP